MNEKKLIWFLTYLFALSNFALGQGYCLFNDSASNNWHVKIQNYSEGKGTNRLLLSYQNSLDNTMYPAIGELKDGKIKVI